MFYFTCNESKIYESFTFWNKLQEKITFSRHSNLLRCTCMYICIYTVYIYIYIYIICICVYIYIYIYIYNIYIYIYIYLYIYIKNLKTNDIGQINATVGILYVYMHCIFFAPLKLKSLIFFVALALPNDKNNVFTRFQNIFCLPLIWLTDSPA